MLFPPLAILSIIVIIIILSLATPLISTIAATLPNDEVRALKESGKRLGKNDWNFQVDPCSGTTEESSAGWIVPQVPLMVAVTCGDCSFSTSSNFNTCHIVSIVLKAQNLTGTLPPEFVKLPYLKEIDLTDNYLNGTIPPEWGSLNLRNLVLRGNRLTGPIPKELGNISTLEILTLEENQLSGKIPIELGNLSSIQRFYLSSNYLTGELPNTLAGLTTMTEFKIGDNLFSGKIPDFIEGWTHLERLIIQASGLAGPIPSGLARLTNLTDVRITDLNGPDSTVPPFRNMTNLKHLILRSCNLIGELPPPFGSIHFKTLDLSFNKLTGKIPESFKLLKETDYIYLTGNLLSGDVPDWMLREDSKIDLSYNNLTFESWESSCQSRNLNLFGISSKNSAYGIASCLRGFVCPSNVTYFHVNCGGADLNLDGSMNYEADTEAGGPTKFSLSRTNWAFSSTGHFVGDGHDTDSYIVKNTSRLSMNNSNLYMDARLSPLSLTYYGFCLVNGYYTVRLHFAEIMFTDDKTYSSLGRRIFDIFIQGKLVEKDFNIADEAGGVGKEIVKSYNASVTNTTLEIRFYWAGKGTNSIPVRGVYGPLISAISVDSHSNINLPIENRVISEKGKRVSAGTIIGSVAAVVFAMFLVLGILCWRGFLCHRDTAERDLNGMDLNTSSFTLRQIKAATKNFDAVNIIGQGGFGLVYKGILSDGTIVAVKQLSSKSKQGNREFVTEIGMISALQHPNLVKLHGCCIEGNQFLTVYEYLENNSLARALFGPEECRLLLDWPTRYKICIGVARGLAYLHEESGLKVVHRDIKASNVLLDKNFSPKISDFGLAKLYEDDDTHISTRIAGTYGYMAPEYALRGYLTDKADVYSYGIVALEIISGMANIVDRTKQNCFILLDMALRLKDEGNLVELVDPTLGSEFNKEEAMVMINVALLCTNISPTDRPMMSSVVSMLEGRSISPELLLDQSLSNRSTREMNNHSQQSHVMASMSDSQVRSISIEGSWADASTSTVNFSSVDHSEYLGNTG